MCYCMIINHDRPNSGKVKEGVDHEVLHRMFLENVNIQGRLHRRAGIQSGF